MDKTPGQIYFVLPVAMNKPLYSLMRTPDRLVIMRARELDGDVHTAESVSKNIDRFLKLKETKHEKTYRVTGAHIVRFGSKRAVD